MDLFSYTPSYPQTPGFKARETSADADDAMRPKASILREKCLAMLREPMTADEVAAALGESVLAIRPRCSELATMGKIEDTGIRRKNASGRNAIAWRAKP